mmetsp:Transcript_10332/g.10330  ORF Transcript_10332/g.10330 Transcript_10332/m.10330 type:complete len:96 (+) Transcript_10332:706-993(+)
MKDCKVSISKATYNKRMQELPDDEKEILENDFKRYAVIRDVCNDFSRITKQRFLQVPLYRRVFLHLYFFLRKLPKYDPTAANLNEEQIKKAATNK